MDEKELNSLNKCVSYMRKNISPDWQIQQLHMLLVIAINHPEGITQPDLAKECKMEQGPVSRNCQALALKAREGKDGNKEILGHDLIYMTPDIFYRRQLNCRLTPKGEKTIKEMLSFFKDTEK